MSADEDPDQKAYEQGKCAGLAQAAALIAGQIEERASREFLARRDDQARTFREIAAGIREQFSHAKLRAEIEAEVRAEAPRARPR